MRVLGIDHIVLRVRDLENMVRFYRDALGCRVERRSRGAFELVQLRAGSALIDLIAPHGASGPGDAHALGAGARDLDHFCLRVEPFSEEVIRKHLAPYGITCGPLQIHYGAEGEGPALTFEDPEGNVVELKGPANSPVEDAMALGDERCEACRPGAPKVTEDEIEELWPGVPDWLILEREGIKRLERTYEFPDFATALAFANRVGEEAEREGHHPDLLVTWGAVTVSWWSHKIRGLHRNDFVMAARTDALYA